MTPVVHVGGCNAIVVSDILRCVYMWFQCKINLNITDGRNISNELLRRSSRRQTGVDRTYEYDEKYSRQAYDSLLRAIRFADGLSSLSHPPPTRCSRALFEEAGFGVTRGDRDHNACHSPGVGYRTRPSRSSVRRVSITVSNIGTNCSIVCSSCAPASMPTTTGQPAAVAF